MIWDLTTFVPNFELARDHDLQRRDGARYQFALGATQIVEPPFTPQNVHEGTWSRFDGRTRDFQFWSTEGYVYLGFQTDDGLLHLVAQANPLSSQWFSDESYRLRLLRPTYPRLVDDETVYVNHYPSTLVTLRDNDFAHPVALEPAPETYVTIARDLLPTGERALCLSGRVGDSEERWWFGYLPAVYPSPESAALSRGIRRTQQLVQGVVQAEQFYDRWLPRQQRGGSEL